MTDRGIILYHIYRYQLAIGNVKENVAPFPSLLFLAHILPPCASIIFLQIYRPRPVPEKDLDENLVKSLGIISESTPEPLSHTSIMAISLLLSLLLSVLLSTVIITKPSEVNFRALFSRLEITWASLFLSA